MRKSNNFFPVGVCQFVLDKCITRLTDTDIDDTTSVNIKVDYELLEDWFSDWMQTQPDSSKSFTFLNMILISVTFSGYVYFRAKFISYSSLNWQQ